MSLRNLLLVATACLALSSSAEQLQWHNAREFTIEGKGWNDTKDFYDRLPARAEKMVRPPVWSLSHDSAGMCVRFTTDATNIWVRWVLRKEALAMPHMPASGVSGVDLYTKDKGRWTWAGGGRPKDFPTNEVSVLKPSIAQNREYMLYLPLYNGVSSVEIGVSAGTKIAPLTIRKQRPIVFYGTSILQGGCAARPGMAYPSLIGRHLDWPIINLGFSGNAKSEPELAQLLAELDPAIYVLDPLPNMDAAGVRERIEPFVKTLRKAHPKTPIVLVEHVHYTEAPFVSSRYERYSQANIALKEVYQRLLKTEKNISYISSEHIIGDDAEGTVDGTHPTDLGFARMAETIEPVLKKLLKKER